MPFQVVFDTCVLVPLPLRDTLLTLAAEELFVPRWAARSLDSMERVLVERFDVTTERASETRRQIARVFAEAEISAERIAALEPAMGNHEDDRYILAAAVASNAAKIVTLNLRHFPLESCEHHGVEAISPDEFLLDLLSLNPDRVVAGVHRQAARLRRPPMSFGEVLDRLARHTPEFAARLRVIEGA